MKRVSNLLLLTLTTMVVLFTNCKKDNEDPGPQTITEIVVENPDFSILEAAVLRIDGLAEALSGGTLTVFAPNDAAFANAGLTLEAIETMDETVLAGILNYHVLGTTIVSSAVPASAAVATLQGAQLYVSNNVNGVFANGIPVIAADVAASNGVIHVIDNVLIPPSLSIAGLLSANPDYTYLVAAVVRAGLLDAVSNPGNLTVFAPDNDAFIAAGFPTIESIETADATLMNTVVSYHVLGTNVFASDLTNGATPTSLQGSTLTVTLPPPAVKLTSSSNEASNIVGVNNVATNGVVHFIDKVIL
jgi:uncharacterized surface protein with fasciclin (FAS1) repeats